MRARPAVVEAASQAFVFVCFVWFALFALFVLFALFALGKQSWLCVFRALFFMWLSIVAMLGMFAMLAMFALVKTTLQ